LRNKFGSLAIFTAIRRTSPDKAVDPMMPCKARRMNEERSTKAQRVAQLATARALSVAQPLNVQAT
jgi:hypothetical protein